MTTAFGNTGGGNVGTAYGKVRIDYVSSGVGKAAKEVEALQHSIVDTGKAFDATGSHISKATAQVNQFAAQAGKAGKPVSNPAAGLGKAVTKEVSQAQASLGTLSKIQLKTAIKVTPGKITIDRGAISKAVNTFGQQGLSQGITLNANIKVNPSSVTVDTNAIGTAIRNARIGAVAVEVPVTVDPRVTVKAGAIQNAVNSATQGVSGSVGAAGGSGGGGGGAGLASALGVLGRVAPVATAAAAAVGAVGVVFTKGFSRLQNLDQAAIKLKALGYQGDQIKAISDKASKSVDGLAFGLDEAFSTSADALNAGVQIKDLDKYLSAVANTASLAGVGMQDLGQQLSGVAISGKLDGQTLETLVSRNVPVLKLLGDEYGVTQQKAAEMVSNSEVDFNHLINALSKTGDAGRIMGNTVSGSFKNLMASVSRIGAMLLAPLFGAANGEASTFAKGIQFVTGKLKELEGWIKDHRDDIVDFWVDGGKAALTYGKYVLTVTGSVLEGIGKMIEGIGHVPSAFAGIFDTFGAHGIADNLRGASDAATDLGQGVFDAGQKVFDFKGNLDPLYGKLDEMGQAAKDAANATGDLGDAADNAGPPMESLSTALDKLGVKGTEVEKSLKGPMAQFKEMLKTLKDKGASQPLLDQLTKLRSAWDNGGRAAKNYTDALSNMADTSLKASDRADALISSMKELGLLPGGDALAEYNKQFNEMTSYSSTLADQLDTLGTALVNVDGTINSNSNNGAKLVDVLNQISQTTLSTALSGDVAPEDVFASTTKELQQVLSQFGVVGEDADKVISKYLTPIQAQFNGKTPDEVLKNTLGNDPAKLDTALNLLTTSDDILTELTGGPGQSIKIPATIDVTNPDVLKPGTAGHSAGTNAFPNGNPNTTPKEDLSGGGGSFDEKPAIVGDVKHDSPLALENFFKNWSVGSIFDIFGSGDSPVSFNKPLTDAFNNKDAVTKTLGENQDIAAQLNPIIDQANQSGKSVADAFAEGINSGSDEVKEAIIKLAGLVGDGLGNSPAKYGPLSGKGYSLYRGQKVTQAFATGLESQSGAVKSATETIAGAAGDGMSSGGPMGQALTMDDKLTRAIGDLQELSDFGKSLLDFGKQLGDIAFGSLKIFNDLSGGRLFPKSYVTDPSKKPSGSALGGSGLSLKPNGPLANATNASSVTGGKGQIPLVQNPDGTWTSSNPEWAKLIARESGGDPKVVQGIKDQNSGGNEATGLFQIAKGTWASNGGTAFAPEAKDATPEQQAQIAAKIFADQGGSPWGSGANQNLGRENEALLRAGLTGGASPAITKPVVDPSQTATPATGLQMKDIGNGYFTSGNKTFQNIGGKFYDVNDLNIGPDGKPALNSSGLPLKLGTPAPTTPFTPPIGSAGSGLQVPTMPYGLKPGTDTGGYGSGGKGIFPDWVQQLGSIFGVVPSTYSGHQESDRGGEKGYAPNPQDLNRGIDWTGTPEQMKAFASYLAGIAPSTPGLEQIIYEDPNTGQRVGLGGSGNPTTGYYPDTGEGSYAEHRNHVHTRQSTSLPLPGTVPLALQGDSATGMPGGPTALGLLDQIAGNTSGMPYLPQQLKDFAIDKPDLQKALALPGGANQADAITALQSLDANIADATKAGNTGLADSLGQKKSQLQNAYGLKEGPSGLDQAQGIFQGAAGIASDVFAAIDAGLKTATAVKDTGDLFARGISNTADVNRLIDNVQVGIDLAGKIFAAAGSITSFVGQFTQGGAGFGDGGATSAVGGVLSMVSQVIGTVNTGIDIAQEAYKIGAKYFGRAMTSFLGFPGASDMNFLLDEVTGQVKAYTSDNPQNKTTLNTLGRELGSSRYSERPAPTNYLTVYQGPGQDPRDTMDDAMYTVRASGVGAFGYDG